MVVYECQAECLDENCPFYRSICGICGKQLCYKKNNLCTDSEGFKFLRSHTHLSLDCWGKVVNCCSECKRKLKL
jgi:hypothetical protein